MSQGATITPALEWNVKSRKNVTARVNRLLRLRGEKLVRSLGHERDRIGDYYLVNSTTQQITAVMLDLEAVARHLGALQPWEKLGAHDAR